MDYIDIAHQLGIEFDKEPDDISLFTAELDKALQNINSDYEAKRYNNFVMKAPLIHKAKKGLFHNWLKNKGKLGGQHKVPRLSNDRKYIEEILAIMK